MSSSANGARLDCPTFRRTAGIGIVKRWRSSTSTACEVRRDAHVFIVRVRLGQRREGQSQFTGGLIHRNSTVALSQIDWDERPAF